MATGYRPHPRSSPLLAVLTYTPDIQEAAVLIAEELGLCLASISDRTCRADSIGTSYTVRLSSGLELMVTGEMTVSAVRGTFMTRYNWVVHKKEPSPSDCMHYGTYMGESLGPVNCGQCKMQQQSRETQREFINARETYLTSIEAPTTLTVNKSTVAAALQQAREFFTANGLKPKEVSERDSSELTWAELEHLKNTDYYAYQEALAHGGKVPKPVQEKPKFTVVKFEGTGHPPLDEKTK